MDWKFETIISKCEGKVATIILNRPEKRNALNSKMFEELVQAIDEVSKDDSTAVLVITGNGSAFSSGLDMDDLATLGGHKGERKDRCAEETRLFFHRSPRAISLGLQNMYKPVIAMVNGAAISPSCDLALACDIRTGSEKTYFTLAQVDIGSVPGLGGVWMLPRLVGYAKAAEILWTGDKIDADEAYRIGMLNHIFPAAQLEEKTMELAERIASKPQVGLRLSKLGLRRGLETNLETSLELTVFSEAIATHSIENEKITAELWQQFQRRKVQKGG